MTTTRRALALLTLTLAVLVTATLPANAAFDDRAPAVTATVGTLTVQPPTNVKVDSYCVVTTTETRHTVYRDPVTGATSTRSYSVTSSSQGTRTNQNGNTTSTVAGPGTNETTTTTTTVDTELYATASWTRSTTPDVQGYLMTAHLGNGYTFVMEQGANSTSMSANADADYISTSLKLSIDTLTTYKWTASSALSKNLSC
ncbi:hypothetical protein [Geodermatophilus sp. CPCC 205761]|uniref:hypothetical protein n=1 Tax=Geodermatophilus sp. CPCC 205761 TaxID=2936597 RepID=UPI003EEF22A6